MAHDVSAALAGGWFPARAGTATGAAGIEAKAGDCEEYVAFADVNCDPIARAFFSIIEIAA